MRTFAFILRVGASCLLMLSAAVCGLIEFIAIVDPVGTKMADDYDPFGDPHIPWYTHAIWCAAVAGMVTAAVWIWPKRRRKRDVEAF